MAYESGKGGVLTYNSVPLSVIDWEVDVENNVADTTNALSPNDPGVGVGAAAAAATYITGPVTRITGTANVLWDSAAIPDSISLSSGLSATATLVLGTSGSLYSGTMFVKNRRERVNTREGALQFALSFVFSGAVTRPA